MLLKAGRFAVSAFYCSVAGLRVARTFASLALRPLLQALYGGVAWATAGGRGLVVSGGNPSSQC